jgi:hypothetical protein
MFSNKSNKILFEQNYFWTNLESHPGKKGVPVFIDESDAGWDAEDRGKEADDCDVPPESVTIWNTITNLSFLFQFSCRFESLNFDFKL